MNLEAQTSLYEPVQAVILAIDPGAEDGWATWVPGSNISPGRHGSTAGGQSRGEVVAGAKIDAAWCRLPLIVVAEKWTAGGWQSHDTLIGLGAAWGKWEAALEEHRVPKSRVVRVYPQTWRSRILPGRQRSTEQWKADAVARAQRELGRVVTHNEADAVCIALWAMHAAEVRAKMPKRARAR